MRRINRPAFLHSVNAVPPLLDAIGLPTTAGAYSVRVLRAAYGAGGGALVHLRKVGDATGIDVGADSNGNLLTSAVLAYAAGGSATATWPDQGSSVVGILDSTSQAAEPKIVNSGALIGVGNFARPGIQTDGSSTFLKHASSSVGQPLTRLTVLRFDSVASGQDIYSNGVDNSLFFSGVGALSTYAGASAALKSGIAAGDVACVIEMLNSSSSQASYNGVEVGTINPSTTGMTYRALGAAYGGSAGSAFAACTLLEHVIFPVSTTAQDRAAMYANVRAYYGLP